MDRRWIGVILFSCLIASLIPAFTNGQCAQLKTDKSQKDSSALLQEINKLSVEIRNKEHKIRVPDERINGIDEFDFIFKLCPDNPLNSAGVTQTAKGSDTATVLGRINETHAEKSVMNDMFTLFYTGGDKYGNACNKSERRAMVNVRCPAVPVSEPLLKYYHENVAMGEDFCFYLFEFLVPADYLAPVLQCSKSVSPVQVPSTVSTTAPTTTSAPFHPPPLSKSVIEGGTAEEDHTHHLSAGSIILLITLIPALIFFVFGALYKRFVMGAHGIEQVPFIDFWRNCGSLQAAGWRYVTSLGRSRGSRYDEYSAVSTDEEREILDPNRPNDDHLLPM